MTARRLLAVLAIAAAAAVAVALNVILLGKASAQNDPVGKLVPATTLPVAPQGTVRPTTGPIHDEGSDD